METSYVSLFESLENSYSDQLLLYHFEGTYRCNKVIKGLLGTIPKVHRYYRLGCDLRKVYTFERLKCWNEVQIRAKIKIYSKSFLDILHIVLAKKGFPVQPVLKQALFHSNCSKKTTAYHFIMVLYNSVLTIYSPVSNIHCKIAN